MNAIALLITEQTNGLFEDRPHRFSVEASALGILPGEWPESIETTLGNGQPFHLHNDDHNAIVYKQTFGCVFLTVFND